jgi:hypothetical protein
MTLHGTGEAQRQLARIARGCAALAHWRGFVGSRLPYAYGAEYGTHRVSGRLARRAGGTRFLESAVGQVMTGADKDISDGLTKVSAPGRWVIRRLALWARRLARAGVPRQKGRLRRSIRVELRKV